MAAEKKTQKTIDVWKKKRWHKVLAPRLFNEQIIGETPALEPALLKGRTIKSNLMFLTRDMKKQHVDIIFEIEKVMGDTAYTYMKKMEIAPSFIRRYIRRAKCRIDDAFRCTTSDGVELNIKPFFVTANMTSNSVCTAIRKRSKDYIMKHVVSTPYETVMYEATSFKLQRALRDLLRNIYPLKSCEIRVLEVVSDISKRKAVPKEKPKEAEKPAEEIRPEHKDNTAHKEKAADSKDNKEE